MKGILFLAVILLIATCFQYGSGQSSNGCPDDVAQCNTHCNDGMSGDNPVTGVCQGDICFCQALRANAAGCKPSPRKQIRAFRANDAH